MAAKLTIQDMHRLAATRGGKCLSTEYRGNHKPIRWSCGDCGHEWEAAPSSIKTGTWCPECGKKKIGQNNPRRGTIEKARAMAEAHGGQCLSSEYLGANSKLRWRCAKGHEWYAVPNSIRRGTWCSICAGKKRKTIEEMHELAASRGGKCLSSEYVNQRTPLRWRCGQCGHSWDAAPSNVGSNGSWCPKCSGNLPPTMEEIHALAEERGGKCLSTKYSCNSSKLKWKCACGNEWMANWNNVKNGTWCPKCQSGLGERICRAYFEQLFGAPFPPAHPAWLPASSGRNLELDGYNESLGLAFEHQGRHHFEELGFGVSEKEAQQKHLEVVRRDKVKARICAERGITLIPVPEIPKMLPLNEVREFIKLKCEEAQFSLPHDFLDKPVDLKPAFQSYRALKALNRIKEFAESKEGQCLSDFYVNTVTPLLFQCKKGHRWETTPGSILYSDSWCPKCSGNLPPTMEEIRDLAEERGGKCLSSEYSSNKAKLKWKCACGNEWMANWNSVSNGRWCPKCWEARRGATRRLSIEEMQSIAKERGGSCLSSKYVNSKTKLEWECGFCNHRWKASPGAVKGGTWCPKCAGNQKSTIR